MATAHYCDRVRSFLGFVSYYRRFIPNFSKVAKPFNKLLQNLDRTPSQKKKFKVHWGPEQQEAFETLQRLCTESPILAYADFKALSFSTQMLLEMDLVQFCIRSRRETEGHSICLLESDKKLKELSSSQIGIPCFKMGHKR